MIQINIPNRLLPDLEHLLLGATVLQDYTGPNPHFGGDFRGCHPLPATDLVMIAVGLDDTDGYGRISRTVTAPLDATTAFYLPEAQAGPLFDLVEQHQAQTTGSVTRSGR